MKMSAQILSDVGKLIKVIDISCFSGTCNPDDGNDFGGLSSCLVLFLDPFNRLVELCDVNLVGVGMNRYVHDAAFTDAQDSPGFAYGIMSPFRYKDQCLSVSVIVQCPGEAFYPDAFERLSISRKCFCHCKCQSGYVGQCSIRGDISQSDPGILNVFFVEVLCVIVDEMVYPAEKLPFNE